MDKRSNHYVPWIREYSGEMYQKVVEICLGALPVCSAMFPLDADEITAMIEGIGPITPDSRSGPSSGRSVLCWTRKRGI